MCRVVRGAKRVARTSSAKMPICELPRRRIAIHAHSTQSRETRFSRTAQTDCTLKSHTPPLPNPPLSRVRQQNRQRAVRGEKQQNTCLQIRVLRIFFSTRPRGGRFSRHDDDSGGFRQIFAYFVEPPPVAGRRRQRGGVNSLCAAAHAAAAERQKWLTRGSVCGF